MIMLPEQTIKTPEQARTDALTKALQSKEYIDLITMFNNSIETWDGQTPIERPTSFNQLANNLFEQVLTAGGWQVVRTTRRESDMRGDIYDQNIFKITETSKFNISDK